jgi:hypothetical protein
VQFQLQISVPMENNKPVQVYFIIIVYEVSYFIILLGHFPNATVHLGLLAEYFRSPRGGAFTPILNLVLVGPPSSITFKK